MHNYMSYWVLYIYKSQIRSKVEYYIYRVPSKKEVNSEGRETAGENDDDWYDWKIPESFLHNSSVSMLYVLWKNTISWRPVLESYFAGQEVQNESRMLSANSL